MPDRTVLRACLLLLLAQQPSYGYEVRARLRSRFGWDGDAGGSYRALRAMESEGLLASVWSESPLGPRRRHYRVTPAGHEELARLTGEIADARCVLNAFLSEARTVQERAAS